MAGQKSRKSLLEAVPVFDCFEKKPSLHDGLEVAIFIVNIQFEGEHFRTQAPKESREFRYSGRTQFCIKYIL